MFYALDDPYIHLALAENLLHGHYGINPGEVASPSSSILYPFLLALFGAGPYAPLILNFVGALGTAWVLGGFLFDAFDQSNTRPSPITYLSVVTLLGAVNGYALALTGMEHTLHVLASLLILRGLTHLSRETRPDGWMLLGLIAAPLLRFEGFALSLFAIFALFAWGHWRSGAAVTLVLSLIVAAYVGLMTHLGLPPLPSSVLVKSSVSAGVVDHSLADAFASHLQDILTSLERPQAKWLIAGLAMLCFAFVPPLNARRLSVALVVGAAAVAHVLVGHWGWYGRYEAYIMATVVGAVLYVWTPVLSSPRARSAKLVLLLVLTFVSNRNYITPLLTTHLAARNVYEQQYQMHRFATEFFPETTAVNDLGWVAYRNDNYVLDLWGLGSEIVRQNWAQYGLTTNWVEEIAEDKDAVFAMVYPAVFTTELPPEWCHMGTIRTNRVMSAYENVGFFLIDRSREADMREALNAFKQTLPADTRFTAAECSAPYDWTLYWD
ncbi:hypothetical protein [Celeribacter litoreus]|uniref:hypothetical protein n=1 Tax=Celeribacter litoreus TaxID=2876714 RepID=UPI001CCBBED9|nr:hypothetical protein [Celeribacter litoreus]MCA0041899.1 hypothetical protein [Celeribacter litoreus]